MRWATGRATLLPALLAAGPAFASGGEHVVDDAAVETLGTCHLESWVTLPSGDGGLVNNAPACTRKAWPNLELGGFIAHGWTRGSDDTLIGLSPKLMLRSERRGVGAIDLDLIGGRNVDGATRSAITFGVTIRR